MSIGYLHELSTIRHVSGYCFAAPAPLETAVGDDPSNNWRSNLRLFEDGREIGPGHSIHERISRVGCGAFSHWGNDVLFSSSDGTDPRTNARTYVVLCQDSSSNPLNALVQSASAANIESLGDEERYAWGERFFNAFVSDVRLSEYGRSFFSDAAFKADYEQFEPTNYHSYDRKFALFQFARFAARRAGDFAECGVFRGASAFLMAKAMRASASRATLHLFDSFEGLSEPNESDGTYWMRGALSCPLPEVRENLARFADCIAFHPGWIPERFEEVSARRFSLVHVDVDLYQPTRDALQFFGPRMTPSGLLICDDYGFDTCPGARKALDEYAAAHDMTVIHLPTGQGVLIFAPR